jgi:hypothetical protein
VTDINRSLLGEPNAPCRTCGSPLAADQRYCLQCGARRAEARLPFLDILAQQAQQVPQGAGAPAATGAAASPPGSWLGRMSTNAAAVAGVACLLLALGVGVLIGGLGQNDSSANATPQVISVGGAAPAAAAPVASTAAPAPTETTGDTTTTTPKDTTKDKSSKKAASTTKATNNAVKKLDSSAGGDYAKKSEKLPKTLGTGGKAPPVDKSKPVGGGSDVESIG